MERFRNFWNVLGTQKVNMLLALIAILVVFMIQQETQGFRPTGVFASLWSLVVITGKTFAILLPTWAAGTICSHFANKVIWQYRRWPTIRLVSLVVVSVGAATVTGNLGMLFMQFPADIHVNEFVLWWIVGAIIYWLGVWAIWPPGPDDWYGL